MMLDCFVRLVALTTKNSFNRPVQSNLYLGIRRIHVQEPRLVLVTRNSVTEFKVINNIKRIYRKEINDGKVGVELRSPPFQLLINGNREELLNFIELLIKLADKKVVEQMDVIPVIPLLHKPKLVISSKTSGTKSCANSSVLDQKTVNTTLTRNPLSKLHSNLKVLDLPNSNITRVPKKLGKINVQTVNLEGNELTDDDLLWLDELPIRKTLEILNLAANNIRCFPSVLVDYHRLFSLNLRDNCIRYIPGGIGCLKSLRFLNLSENHIRFLPASLLLLKLTEIDLTYNNLTDNELSNFQRANKDNVNAFISLKDLAAKAVKSSYRRELTYQDCPKRLLDRIRNSSACVCGAQTVPISSAQYFAALVRIKFAITYKIHPQTGDFEQTPMHSLMHKGNGNGNIFVLYHFCTFLDRCEKVKVNRDSASCGFGFVN